MELDRHCPHCGCAHGNVHSAPRRRAIRDPKVSGVWQQRLQCPRCQTTWTLRAAGVQAGRQRSDRHIGLCLLGYMLGMSYRGIATFVTALGCGVGKSTVDRDVAAAGRRVRRRREVAPGMRVRVLGVDGTGAAMAGRNAGLLFCVDLEQRVLVSVEAIQETDKAAVVRHVRKVFQEVGAEELRTDEHSCYQGVVPEGRHRLCVAHWRKSKAKRARELLVRAQEERRPLEVRNLQKLLELLALEPRPPTVPEELERLVRGYVCEKKGLLWKINQLLQHVERTWSQVSCDSRDATNNATESLIGLTYKIRVKTMRGMTSEEKVLNHPFLSEALRGRDGVCEMSDLL